MLDYNFNFNEYRISPGCQSCLSFIFAGDEGHFIIDRLSILIPGDLHPTKYININASCKIKVQMKELYSHPSPSQAK